MNRLSLVAMSLVCLGSVFWKTIPTAEAAPGEVVKLWPGEPPAWNAPAEEEGDTSKADSRPVAGRAVVRLGNVTSPELHAYPVKDSEHTVIVCPGGGFSILAWDLEGTEIAEWLQSNGVSAVVLKYRVPTRGEDTKWLPPVQDLQRSIALVRSGKLTGFGSGKVGVMGFSAGGHTATRATLATQRLYDAVDASDDASVVPDFAGLIYTAYLGKDRDSVELSDELKVTSETPPVFFAHAFDDRINCLGAVALFTELKKQGVPSSLHIFSTGGHGFGGRDTGNEKDYWLPLFKAWMKDRGF